MRAAGIDPLIHVAGSSKEYGLVCPEELPIKETNPLRPLSPYAASKVAQEKLAWQYHRSYGLRTVVTRGFNHEGPRRGEVFVTSSSAKQIAMIEAGLKTPPVIYVGDLSSERDWTDVRDVVRTYWLALEHGLQGEVYNIGSGVRRSVGEMRSLVCVTAQHRDAKSGTLGRVMVFPYETEWERQFYQEKEVTVYYKVTDEGLILLTVKARYGQGFPRG